MTERFEYYDGANWIEIPYVKARVTMDTSSDNTLTLVTGQEQTQPLNGDEEVRLIDENQVLVYQGFLQSQGRISQDGTARLTAKTLGQEVLGEQVVINEQNTTTTTLFNELWSNTPYTTEVTNATTYNLTEYSNRLRRGDALGELTKPYNHYITFKPEGGGTVVYAELGSTTSGLTFDDSNAVVRKIERNIERSTVGKAIVKGVDTNGNTFQVTSGTGTPVLQYTATQTKTPSEAQNIADNLVQGRKDDIDITTREAVRNNIVGQTVNISFPSRNTTGTYTVIRQTTQYPTQQTLSGRRGTTELSLGFDEGVEKDKVDRSERQRFLNIERGQLTVSTEDDVGGQNVQGNTDQGTADISTSEGNRDPDVDGFSASSNVDVDYRFTSRTTTNNVIRSRSVPFISGSCDYAVITVSVSANREGSSFTDSGWDLTIANEDTNTTLFSENGIVGNYESFTTTIVDPDALEGDSIEAVLIDRNNNGWVINLSLTVQAIGDHDHSSGSYRAGNHNHSVFSSDGGHPHSLDLLTDSNLIRFSEVIDTSKE